MQNDAGAAADSSHLDPQAWGRGRATQEWQGLLHPRSPLPGACLLQ